jgi:LemA protein
VIYLVIVIIALGFVFVVLYNKLVRARNRVKEAWSGIDVQLKRRHDLIPNIIEAVKGYSSFEKSVLEKVTRTRTLAAGAKETGEVENEVSRGIKEIFAIAESYPDLKANRSFLDLQKTLAEVENDLQHARRYYNGSVRDYNTLVQTFPTMIVAGIFGFRPEEFFEIEYATEREAPDVEWA